MASVPNTEFWSEFIELYESFPEVWKIKSEKYKNKVLKEKAYQCLLHKFKELEPNASIDLVKKKINNLRTCYRRELKRQLQSEKSGAGVDDIYTPSLWYFDKLNFLKDHEVQVGGISSMSNDDEDCFVASDEEEASPSTSKKRITEKHLKIQRNEILQQAVKHLENSNKRDDDATVFGAHWAIMFRKLKPNQQSFANRAIMEVLYQGELGKLDEYSYRAFEGTSSYSPCSRTSSSLMYSGTSSPISSDENFYQLQSASHSPIHQKLRNISPQSIRIPRPQPKSVRFIPYQAHTPDVIFDHQYEESQTQESSQYTNVQDLFSDPEYT